LQLRGWALFSQKVFLKSFCRSHPPHKSVRLTFTITNITNKFTNLCENRLLQNDLKNIVCEINLVLLATVRDIFCFRVCGLWCMMYGLYGIVFWLEGFRHHKIFNTQHYTLKLEPFNLKPSTLNPNGRRFTSSTTSFPETKLRSQIPTS